jgi:hypothetical protein
VVIVISYADAQGENKLLRASAASNLLILCAASRFSRFRAQPYTNLILTTNTIFGGPVIFFRIRAAPLYADAHWRNASV